MNGYAPIADLFGHRATQWQGTAPIDFSDFKTSNAGGLSRKVLLLELCARIGYTPHA